MRSGDVRRVWLLLALASACERRPSRRVDLPAPGDASAAGTVAPASQGIPVPGCQAGWWPLVDGERWQWSIERRWTDPGTGDEWREARRVEASVRLERGRATITGWPAPWTAELARPIAIAVVGTRIDLDGSPWIDLGRDARTAGVERRVIEATATEPAALELVWPAMADDLTVRLACGVGPVLVEYHHHGTIEDLRAVRVGTARQ